VLFSVDLFSVAMIILFYKGKPLVEKLSVEFFIE